MLVFVDHLYFPESGDFSSQNAREGPSYAGIQALCVDCLGMGGGKGGTPLSPPTRSSLSEPPDSRWGRHEVNWRRSASIGAS